MGASGLQWFSTQPSLGLVKSDSHFPAEWERLLCGRLTLQWKHHPLPLWQAPQGPRGPGSLWGSPLLTSWPLTHIKNVQHVVTYITQRPFFPDNVNEHPSDNEVRRRQMEGKKITSGRKAHFPSFPAASFYNSKRWDVSVAQFQPVFSPISGEPLWTSADMLVKHTHTKWGVITAC